MDPEYLWLLLAFLFFGGGSWIARHFDAWIQHRRTVRMKKITAALPPVPKEPICGCSHHIAFHDVATGRCHSQIRVVTKWGRLEDDDASDTEGIPVEWENQQCPCRRYSGPEPLTTLYAPELSPIAVEEPSQKEEKR